MVQPENSRQPDGQYAENVGEQSDALDYIYIQTFKERFGYLQLGNVYDVEDAIEFNNGWL